MGEFAIYDSSNNDHLPNKAWTFSANIFAPIEKGGTRVSTGANVVILIEKLTKGFSNLNTKKARMEKQSK